MLNPPGSVFHIGGFVKQTMKVLYDMGISWNVGSSDQVQTQNRNNQI